MALGVQGLRGQRTPEAGEFGDSHDGVDDALASSLVELMKRLVGDVADVSAWIAGDHCLKEPLGCSTTWLAFQEHSPSEVPELNPFRVSAREAEFLVVRASANVDAVLVPVQEGVRFGGDDVVAEADHCASLALRRDRRPSRWVMGGCLMSGTTR